MPPRSSRTLKGRAPQTQPNEGGVPLADPAPVIVPEQEARPFWETKTLDELSAAEWESLCDGCGRCCLIKLEDEDTGEIYRTDIACKLFDAGACRCVAYEQRQRKMHDCVKLTPETVRSIRWLPKTCAYRLVRDRQPLPEWHPLRSGSPESVHQAGVSVRGRIGGTEKTVKVRNYVHHIVNWDE